MRRKPIVWAAFVSQKGQSLDWVISSFCEGSTANISRQVEPLP